EFHELNLIELVLAEDAANVFPVRPRLTAEAWRVGRKFDRQPFKFTAYTPCFRSEADRKSTRLNSSHVEISYAVFCLKKKTAVSRRWLWQPSFRPKRCPSVCDGRYRPRDRSHWLL